MNTLIIRLDSAYSVQTVRSFLVEAVESIQNHIRDYATHTEYDSGLSPVAHNHRLAIVTLDEDCRVFHIQCESPDLYLADPRIVFTDVESPAYTTPAHRIDEYSYMTAWQHIRQKDMTAKDYLSDWAILFASKENVIDIDPRPNLKTQILH
ncbi:hypothetical protein X831_gp119 [Pseudomonas phage PAK_P2]|uniref:Uncharacterized protein n=2 Tax=Pakpunavirus TaxID=1921407 RepID=V5JX64_9CAUD|nr:hypothetical protein X831_gp119 [Pseudomonas phage PAK_P2]YP_008859329.1 hypothetical protein PAK_P400118 [Pseudomonas phage PAK_P4]AGR89239.1 hypothetical protein PAK_P200118 [Pseudomonas phage PAK_P2]AGR89414.1 hypothetical protein PAK_P400118 [Pseudomonas phage PAK_P4]